MEDDNREWFESVKADDVGAQCKSGVDGCVFLSRARAAQLCEQEAKRVEDKKEQVGPVTKEFVMEMLPKVLGEVGLTVTQRDRLIGILVNNRDVFGELATQSEAPLHGTTRIDIQLREGVDPDKMQSYKPRQYPLAERTLLEARMIDEDILELVDTVAGEESQVLRCSNLLAVDKGLDKMAYWLSGLRLTCVLSTNRLPTVLLELSALTMSNRSFARLAISVAGI